MELDGPIVLLLQDLLDSGRNKRVELVGERVAEHRVHDDALVPEESVLAEGLGAVDDLVGDDEVSRSDLLTEGTDGREGDDGLDADGLERGDVRTVGDLGRGDGVVWPVTRDEGDERAGRERGDGDG